jgi:hypothetical protein
VSRTLAAAALASLLALPCAAAAQTAVDYLYVDANEGGSSGGHVGLRIGDDVFHFEYRPPGVLILRREPFDGFRRHYHAVENRNIEVSRLAVSGEAFGRLRDRFRARHVAQRQDLDALDSARADRQILESMLAGRVALDGVGFFAEPDRAPDATLLTLRERVLATYGDDFFAVRRAALLQRLEGLTWDSGTYSSPHRYRDTLTALAALEVLATARPLRPEAVLTMADRVLAVTDTEAAALPALSGALSASLVRLLDSRRPDWGFPLLLGMARLAALDRTRESGLWVFLDAGSATTSAAAPPGAARIAALLHEAGADGDDARRRLFAGLATDGAFSESDHAGAEAAANRGAGIRRAIAAGRDPGIAWPPLPSRSAPYPALRAPAPDVLRAHLAVAVEQEAALDRDFERRYQYNLFLRNCVSELVEELDGALGRKGADHAHEFVPALSTLALADRYQVAEVVRIPSRRQAGLADLYQRENTLKVFVRESNVLTSTLYRRNDRDSAFLFFTDDTVAMRPLFGVANLLTGVGTSAAGLVWLPVDGGRLLKAGFWGTVYSVPELFFQNIRKGSFDR